MNKSDTILVTGAAGLAGSAVVEHFEKEGFTNIAPLTHKDCDLMNAARTNNVFRGVRPVHVFHAAARVYGIMGNMRNQGKSFLENTLINTNVIEAARESGAKKITVMGTNAVYPYPPKLPFNERDIFDGRPHDSESGYAHAKRAMLAQLEAYGTSYGIEWAYIVACNLFGPRDKFDPENGHVLPSLIRKFYEAKRTYGGRVMVWGDGSAQRNFLYIKDLARAAHVIMDSEQDAINVGDGNVWSIRQIVEKLSAITGVDRIEWDSTKPNGQLYREASLKRLNATGFKCAYSIDDALQETWSWYCNHHANSD